ncbi:MAG: hypothetical protein NTV36_01245 [Candidatus Staskawiczbacteria bacterium]|nr:hypothetical protein [Candidatus Staskawiczbacteria bacterium]
MKPFTKINVKPYVIIRCKGMILCGGDEEIPLVFDNNDLARGFAIANDVDDGCEFKTMMLEELVLMCRSTKIHFDSFYLIDHRSQLA